MEGPHNVRGWPFSLTVLLIALCKPRMDAGERGYRNGLFIRVHLTSDMAPLSPNSAFTRHCFQAASYYREWWTICLRQE